MIFHALFAAARIIPFIKQVKDSVEEGLDLKKQIEEMIDPTPEDIH